MEKSASFRLIMISAMYENGGNTTHRFFDGHPELYVYPFESQLGNARVQDFLSSLYPVKYRYPDFPLSGRAEQDYELFFDEELKTFLRARDVSKFRDADLSMDESVRKRRFCEIMAQQPRTRGNIVAAFFDATFDAWSNYSRCGRERAYVGYSPVIGFDGEQILTDFPNGHVVHVVRNPWSAYADTIKRPYPLSLARYCWTWSLMQHFALTLSKRFPDRFHILRFEDVVANPREAMGKITEKLGLSWSDTLLYPSWNGRQLGEIYPWGTIRKASPEANIATMNELDAGRKADIRSYTSTMLPFFEYEHMA
jgi:hypothetical protein